MSIAEQITVRRRILKRKKEEDRSHGLLIHVPR